jgi:hypothetical protein
MRRSPSQGGGFGGLQPGGGPSLRKGAAMKCCRLGKKRMVSSTDRDAAMEYCKLGMKAGANGPGS